MTLRLAAILALALLPTAALCQIAPGTVPAGTPLALAIDQHYPMRVGQPIRGRLLYPIYEGNEILLPKDTIVEGSVVALQSDHKRRVGAVLGGDFTPFHIPEVSFTEIVLADGTRVPLVSGTASNGTPIYRAVSPPPSKGGVVHQQIQSGLTAARNDLAIFIAPGRGDRFLQFIYSQLPYHPQRIEKGTSWTVEVATPIDVPAQSAPASAAPVAPKAKPHFWDVQPPGVPAPAVNTGAWIVEANLAEELSSETSAKGQAITAVVAQPIYNADHTIAVPQGATLSGTVNRAQPARKFNRTGVLSFNFNQLTLPNAETQTVETRLTGADSAQDIALSSEGQAKAKPQDKISVPLILALMASRPLDEDRHEHQTFRNGVGGSAGFGLVGTVIGIAGGSPSVAAGIGYWGAARAFYSRWLGRGQKISFAKDTRIIVETTPRRSAPIKPNAPAVP